MSPRSGSTRSKVSRVTEFDMTSAIKGMNENSVKVTMLSMTSEFAPSIR